MSLAPSSGRVGRRVNLAGISTSRSSLGVSFRGQWDSA